MAETASDVFDIFHPTPVTLRELSAIVISLEIWRCEINKYRSSNTLLEFRPSRELISLKTTLVPDLPTVIYPMIDKYVKIFGDSMKGWLWRYHWRIFQFHFNDQNWVLEFFEDFAYDYDGGIHYARTAERMMRCDRFDLDQKFLIACTYCFEENIRQIWPFVNDTYWEDDTFIENPEFKYWILFLVDDYRIPDPSVEEYLFDEVISHFRPSLEYFWNVIPSENRLPKAIDVYNSDLPSFVRFMLPKLDDQQLNEFLLKNGCELLYALLKNSRYDEEVVIWTWIYVKNAMNEIAFTNLIKKMVQSEVRGVCVVSELDQEKFKLVPDDVYDDRDLDHFVQLCFEIWNTANENLKRSAARDIASNSRLFEVIFNVTGVPPTSREYKFSMAVLSYATYEQRNAFWHTCWQYLIHKTRVEDLDKIMRLCLRDEDEITQFKKNIMANDVEVLVFCSTLLSVTYFDELNKFVRFLLPEMQATRNFKQRLLRCTFLSNEFREISTKIIMKPKEFDEFIKDAYDSVDQSTDFKNELMSSPSVQTSLSINALLVPIEQLIEFINTLVSTERILVEVKTGMINFLKGGSADYKCVVPKSTFTSLLSWCLEGNEEVSKFELSYL
ncbi:uncharacterized protein LOC135848793 isoform X3 [Planococcus citri]